MIAIDANALDVNFKLELHCDAVVAVFGYDGLTITTIRERTNCRMKLLDAGTDPSNRVFDMMGSQESALNAVGLILAEMQKSCGTNPNVCTPSVEGPQYAIKLLVRSDACGCIIGKGGATIQAMRQASGAQIKVDTAEGNSHDQAAQAEALGLAAPPDRSTAINGLITSVHAAAIDVIPRVAQFLKQARQKGFIGFGGGDAAAAAAPPAGDRMQAQAGGVHPLEQGPGHVHPVPSTVVGRVIGPGGVQIREIRDTTGARVRVGNDKIPGTNDRPLTIWGSPEQVQHVLQMVADIIARPDDRPNRGGGGGGRGAPPPPPNPYGAAYGYGPPPGYGA